MTDKLKQYLNDLSLWNQVTLQIENRAGAPVGVQLLQDKPSDRSSLQPSLQGKPKAYVDLQVPKAGKFTSDPAMDTDYILPSDRYDMYLQQPDGRFAKVENPIRTGGSGVMHVRIEPGQGNDKPRLMMRFEKGLIDPLGKSMAYEVTDPAELAQVNNLRQTLQGQGVARFDAPPQAEPPPKPMPPTLGPSASGRKM